ncbi:MAG: pilus assembly protein MshP [Nitrosomonadales bacterium]|nr:pilus assembly protein MshP [Nitrosomonadales bacterium]
MKTLQKGFSIVSAIFLLVVLAFLGLAMATFSVNQQQSAAMDVMGARAYQAARAGVEWGAYSVLIGGPGACVALTPLPAGTLAGTLSGFAVAVTCAPTTASEVGTATGTVTVYDLTSTATQGIVGQPDYVERRIQVSIAN